MTGRDGGQGCRREQLGAYVLGCLPADEAPALLAHLDGCPACRVEAGELRSVADLLPLAEPDRVAAPPAAPPPWLGDRVLDAVARRRRARRWAVAAAAAVVVAVVAVGVVVTGSGVSPPARVPVAFTDVPAGVEVSAALEQKPWGTLVHLEATGLEAGQVYAAWLARPDGSRISAGTFQPGPGRDIRCYLSAALAPEQAAALGVSTPDGRTVLLGALGGPAGATDDGPGGWAAAGP